VGGVLEQRQVVTNANHWPAVPGEGHDRNCTEDGRIGTKFVQLKGTASITGVGFFDKNHNQFGRAPNAIELHPALSFTSTNCERA
jgi:hypothetical protein